VHDDLLSRVVLGCADWAVFPHPETGWTREYSPRVSQPRE
jgi:hypothetical protein